MTAHRREQGNGRTMPRLRSWRALAGLAFAFLVGVGVVLLIGKAAGFARVVDVLEGADRRWLVLCFLAEVVSFTAYGAAYRGAVAFEGGPRIGLGLSLRVIMASLAATRIVAAAGAGGLAVTYWSLRRVGFGSREAGVRMLGLNTLVYLPFALLAFVAALLALLDIGGSAPPGMILPWLAGIPFCLVAARWVTEPGRAEWLSRPVGGWLRRAFAFAIAGTAWVRRAIRDTNGRVVFAASVVYWLADALCLWAALRAFDVHLGASEIFLVYATGYVAMVLPLPFAGVGGVDAAMTYALTAVGVPLAASLVGVVAWRLFGFWLPTIPAAISLGLLSRTARALEQAAGQEPAEAADVQLVT